MKNLSFSVLLNTIAFGATIATGCVSPHPPQSERAASEPQDAAKCTTAGCVSQYSPSFDFAAQKPQKDAAGCPASATDRDGNRYNTVLIGEQCWLAENLRVKHYRDGSAIPKEQMAVIDLEKYGYLYRWPAVSNPSGLCPAGWHVPSDAEYQQLELAVGMTPETVKETGWRKTGSESRELKAFDVASKWTDEERARVNQSGFSALPGGGSSGWLTTADGLYGDFWTSTEYNDERAWHRSLTWLSMHVSRESVRRDHISKNTGVSVRCVQDAT